MVDVINVVLGPADLPIPVAVPREEFVSQVLDVVFEGVPGMPGVQAADLGSAAFTDASDYDLHGAADAALVAAKAYADSLSAEAAGSFERSFAMASTSWRVDHNLGYTPSVTLMLQDRTVISGAVTYNGPDYTVAEFGIPIPGIMALS